MDIDDKQSIKIALKWLVFIIVIILACVVLWFTISEGVHFIMNIFPLNISKVVVN